MNFGDLLHEIPQNLRDLIRKLEKDNKKLISNEWSIKFNLSCLNDFSPPCIPSSAFVYHPEIRSDAEESIFFFLRASHRFLDIEGIFITKLF